MREANEGERVEQDVRPRSRSEHPLRVALLSYRSEPHCGGQGVYLRNLSRELTALGHRVTVLSGPPYPDLDPGVLFEAVPSLQLYVPPGPFKTRAYRNIRSRADVREFWEMMSGRFPEPQTFCQRARDRLLPRRHHFDIVHDNQSLGRGLVDLVEAGFPVIATIHHPLTIDIDAALELADPRFHRSLLRWYRFVDMQKAVAPRLARLLTVSEASKGDIVDQMGVPADRLNVVFNGADVERWRPMPERSRVPGRILTTASSDNPLKGLVHLLEAVAKLRTERHVELVIVGQELPEGRVHDAIETFALRDAVKFVHGITDDDFVELYAEAEIAVVPSLYEGFSLPAVEAMACGVPLVATTGGAIPEVVGPDGEAALSVPPADAGALALAMARLLDDPELRARLGAAGRRRAIERFTWRKAAEQTVEQYRATLADHAGRPPTTVAAARGAATRER